jgi:hypothetical protein
VKLLAYAGALLLTMLAALTLHWAAANFTDAPAPAPIFDDPRLVLQPGAHIARAAVARYEGLPPNERRAVRVGVRASLSTLDDWATATARAGFLCLGERHDDRIREFIASLLSTRLSYQVLMLEAGEDELDSLLSVVGTGGPASLLGARIDGVMHAVGRDGEAPVLVAIDETAAERKRRSRGGVTRRETTLASKVSRGWRDGQHHVALLGALHCRDVQGWLFRRVREGDPRIARGGMHSSAVMARYQEPSAQLLFYLLEEMGIRREVLVITDVSRFPREVLLWLPPVAAAFAGFHSVILFDDAAVPET